MLIIHIAIALISLAWTGMTWFKPSRTKLSAAYGLTGATLATGTYLVISTHQPLLNSCMSGLLYLGVSFAGILASQRKLAHQRTE